jgi:hypothetical protein
MCCVVFLHQLKHAVAAGCMLCCLLHDNNVHCLLLVRYTTSLTCITVRKSIDEAGNRSFFFGKKIIEIVKRWQEWAAPAIQQVVEAD